MTAAPSTGTPVDVEAVRTAIERAQETLALPGRPDLAPLEAELRAHAEALLPAAEAAGAELWHDSLEWWQFQSRVSLLRGVLAKPRAVDPLTAHIQVSHLAADCTALLDHIGAKQ
ncbi:DUF6415 family natural product biosynthesis protein [Streptomyces sp. N2-109]|uniref:DUF6415 family natural product biosynthesis protein n=1 Tax=Streptomyces gossypii TaxID=2883101 RepID=A0ABT2JTK3_9ACTN|nr:DUF6415 family natural product biosynthesis protein [Streptomyces gossypii]MCT2591166.1 DUF6415 family natural product biosynthesis protein [Streptomyces gossypii]